MKKNIIFNKYYRYLRNNVFQNLDISEFMEVYSKFKRLRIQYKILKFANFLERLNIPKVEIFLFRFIFKLIDFIRWKLYDLCILLINGRTFNLFRCYHILSDVRGQEKQCGIVEELERIRTTFPKCLICTNIHYKYQDIPLVDWRQLLETRNRN